MSDKKKPKRIILLSDVHGNLPALDAVLKEGTSHAAAVWNLGDFLGYAPFPNEVVQTLRGVNAVNIIGNHDLKVLDFPRKQEKWKHKKVPQKYTAFQWNYEHLTAETIAYLKSLPRQSAIQVNGLTALLVHGSPESIEEPLGPGTPEARFEELAEAAGVDLIACGHSHEAFVRRVGQTWFVNPGSAGLPEGGDWQASYAVLEFSGSDLSVGHRRVAYDMECVARAVRAAKLPQEFVDVFRKARSLDQLQEQTRTGESAPATSGRALDAVRAFARRCNCE